MDLEPAVRDAAERLVALQQQFATIDARLSAFVGLLDPHRSQFLLERPSEDSVLEAAEEIAVTRVEHARTLRGVRVAESNVARLREAERDRRRTVFDTRRQDLVQKLDAALRVAAEINSELAAVENQQRSATGDWHMAGFTWSELLPPSPETESQLAHWRHAAVEYGFLGRNDGD